MNLFRRLRGLCPASIRDLSGKRVYCARGQHDPGTSHGANGMTWGERQNGILKITHED